MFTFRQFSFYYIIQIHDRLPSKKITGTIKIPELNNYNNILNSFKRAFKSHNKALLILFVTFLNRWKEWSLVPQKEWSSDATLIDKQDELFAGFLNFF